MSDITMSDIDNICETLQNVNITNSNNLVLIAYIRSLNIDYTLKSHLIHLIENDCYKDYLEIYNICLENDIELPPMI